MCKSSNSDPYIFCYCDFIFVLFKYEKNNTNLDILKGLKRVESDLPLPVPNNTCFLFLPPRNYNIYRLLYIWV